VIQHLKDKILMQVSTSLLMNKKER